jgi:hypothetical protein
LGYKVVNLGISTTTKSKGKVRAKARMFIKGHVPAQPSVD